MTRKKLIATSEAHWNRSTQAEPPKHKVLLVVDEVFGPLVAIYRGGERWQAFNSSHDPEQVKHWLEFEHPS